MIICRKLTEAELDVFVQMRIRQLREKGATADIDLAPALLDCYRRYMADGSFIWHPADIKVGHGPADGKDCLFIANRPFDIEFLEQE